MDNNTHDSNDLFAGAEIISMYTAEQAVGDGLLVQFSPATALEAGYALPVLLTRAAYEEAVEWTRDSGLQSEDARFWDVLTVIRQAAKASLRDGTPQQTHVYRIANKTRSGNPSSATSPAKVQLQISAEGFNALGDPCLIIALPGED